MLEAQRPRRGEHRREQRDTLREREHRLEGVTITQRDRARRARASRFMRDVEQGMILAGKKSSVALLEGMLINKASSSARQMFRSIAGITIQEGSEAGLQLNIGARGLNPNRSANFSVRQNGYDIAADPLGYPESYYTPGAEDLKEIQVLRGAAALQYGSQFGGLVNFVLAPPSERPLELKQNLYYGSYQALMSYTRLSGTLGNWGYSLSATYKQGEGYRPNSDYRNIGLLGQLSYQLSPEARLSLDLTKYHYREHQPGGLTDLMYHEDPRQSNRARNWFLIDWNIAALSYQQQLPGWQSQLEVKLQGLYAKRYALGFRDKRVSNPDPMDTPRDLQRGIFRNWGAEARWLKRFHFWGQQPSTALFGLKYYQAQNKSYQGPGSLASDADFSPAKIDVGLKEARESRFLSNYAYPNLSFALFSEWVLRLGEHFSLVPGLRWEWISTKVEGETHYYDFKKDARLPEGYSATDSLASDRQVFRRSVLLPGLAVTYKWRRAELYANLSANYRAVTFNDLKTVTPGMAVNPELKDEKGWSMDIGLRSRGNAIYSYDLSLFCLYYGDRIGEYFREFPENSYTFQRYRDNVGDALSYGLEASASLDLLKAFYRKPQELSLSLFSSLALTDSRYLSSQSRPDIVGNKLEFVPLLNLKGGLDAAYRNWSLSLQTSYSSYQYTDADNEPMNPEDANYGIYGAIPGYLVMDLNLSYQLSKNIGLSLALQNLTNEIYITRRASGYPGPGIIPSAPFNFMFGIKTSW